MILHQILLEILFQCIIDPFFETSRNIAIFALISSCQHNFIHICNKTIHIIITIFLFQNQNRLVTGSNDIKCNLPVICQKYIFLLRSLRSCVHIVF